MGTPLIKVTTGMRRTGKSMFPGQIAYLLASPETMERKFSALDMIPAPDKS